MATRKQIAANRANGLKSNGPRTPEGKRRSAMNALTHGVLSRAVIPPVLEPYESREEYERFLQDLRDDLGPETPTEHMLVDLIAASGWRLARLYRSEAALIARRRDATTRDDALGAPVPHPAIRHLRAVLDDPPALRALVARSGSSRASYTDSQLREFAQGTITTLERLHRQALARWREVAEAESSLPHPDTTQRLGRHDAQLNRQILRALRTLRELQAQRTKTRRLRAPQPDDAAPPEDPLPSRAPRSP